MCMVTEQQSPTVSPCGRTKPLVNIDNIKTPPQLPQHQRRVRFGSNQERVFEKDDYSKEEVFYSAHEFSKIRSGVLEMIQAYNRGKKCSSQQPQQEYRVATHQEESVHWIWRGFEHIPADRSRKQIRKQHATALIHFHQFSDAVGLAMFASTSSKESAKRARELALVDERDAYKIYHNQDDEDEETASETSSSCGSSIVEPPASPQEEPVAMSIHREDSLKTGLLESETRICLPLEQEPSIKSWLLPYQLIMTFLPCAC